MRYYLIAGEPSGDLHGANLIKALYQLDAQAQFRCWGGEKMQSAGATLVKHYKELAFMGFAEVIANLRTILANFDFCKKDIAEFAPDVVILIDYPGFNLRMAKHLKQQGVKVFYYISPQVWAWHSSRVKKIKQYVDRMFVIFPFEKDFYKKWDYEVDFVGHPLLDALQNRTLNENFRQDNNLLDEKPIIAILPGSRKQEISRMLPLMTEAASLFPDYQFVIAGLSSQSTQIYNSHIAQGNVKMVVNQTYDLLDHAYAALVTSGTATIETALFEVPQVVCYKGNWLSYLIGRMIVNVKFIAMVNLVMDREVVAELIQGEFNINSLKYALEQILKEKSRLDILSDYRELKDKLGGVGASLKTAALAIQYLKE